MKKRKKVSVHLKIDEEVWENTKAVMEEMGYSHSGFVEMMCKQVIKAETSPLGDLIEGIVKDVLDKRMASKKGKK
ncbi:MAG TPA: type II toxin-antitoxin system RelB/DinJ family antitoxin [Spirochaetota bacterium]|nr:type II toxin-antitoxin system RelB/DinJ family antitoxin [Spirochaetota bacterium]